MKFRLRAYCISPLLCIGLFDITAGNAQTETPLSDALKSSLATYVAAHHQTPEEYIVSKFKDHDVVYAGEGHMIKQEVELLARVIPKLYQAGIYDLAFEMGLSAEQADIDKLVNAPTYDNTKALTLLFHWDPQSGWAFQEYANVYRAAWEVNHGLPKGAPHFRIVGIDYRPDWSLVKPEDDVLSRLTRWKAWAGSNQITRNVTMADLILRELVAKKRKVLVYGGSGHTALVPTLDKREETGMRFSAAYLIRRQIGERITSVRLVVNRAGDSRTFPAIDAVLAAVRAKYRTVGFDLKGSPLGDLPLPEALASRLVTGKSSATYADEVEGIVHVDEDAQAVTLAPGFLTAPLVAEAKRDGWLPNVPSITLEWILGNVEKFRKNIPPTAAKRAAL